MWNLADRRRADSRYEVARRRAIEFLLSQDISRRAADGTLLGFQATLATQGKANDVVATLERKLGFRLEPELFSNMLVVAQLGADQAPELRELCRTLLATFRDRHAGGLYHFFASLQFACDIDCTAMAARARLATRDIDLGTAEGARELGTINDAILRSAAVCDVKSAENRTHGKENGPLVEHVFKVYLDDHRVQGPERDRGLKIDAVVVSNAINPLLTELGRGLRDPRDVVDLEEYVEGAAAPRIGRGTVAAIVSANVRFVTEFLVTGEYRSGTRYYPSPDAFLCSCAENVRAYPAVFDSLEVPAALRAAVEQRRDAPGGDVATDPATSLNTAMRAIAASAAGLDPCAELDALVGRQDPSGAWTDPDCLYRFGRGAGLPFFRSSAVTTAFALRALSLASGPRGAARARSIR